MATWPYNLTLERTAGSPALAAAAQRDRYADKRQASCFPISRLWRSSNREHPWTSGSFHDPQPPTGAKLRPNRNTPKRNGGTS